MFCLRLHLTFDSENCSENNTKFTIVFAKMIITILLEYFLKFIGLDKNIKYMKESRMYTKFIYILFYNLIRFQATKHMFFLLNHRIVLVLCILSDCNFNDLLQPKCDINLHVQHLSYYKVCRISWPFSRTNIAIIK